MEQELEKDKCTDGGFKIPIAYLALVVSTFSMYFSLQANIAEFRPYVGIRNIELVVLNQGHFEVTALIENTGKVPANNVNIRIFQILEGGMSQPIPDETVRKGLVLMPSEILAHTLRVDTIGLDNLINSNDGLSMIWEVKYDGITTKNHTSLVNTRFNPTFKIFDIVSGFAD